MRPLTYSLVTPVRDEAAHIELTLRSVIDQTLQPLEWVVVDDGSTDATPELVAAYAARHPFISLVRAERHGGRRLGSAEILAFNVGLNELSRPADVIVKLDGDLRFGADYFERLIGRFGDDPKLGIASGVYMEPNGAGQWTPIEMPSYHAFGASKAIRSDCLADIGGFPTTPGWDSADEVKAMARGWFTTHFPDLRVEHHRREGSAMGGLTTAVMHGLIYYVTGGDPLLFPGKVVRRAVTPPYILGGLAVAFGYARAVATRQPRLVTANEAKIYRRLMRQRLRVALGLAPPQDVTVKERNTTA